MNAFRASAFSNERTVASAGAGKTYALTNRFIALAWLYEPETICALTFTRLAAGEFLDKILTKLATAASDEKEAKILGEQIFQITRTRVPTRVDFSEILKKIVRSLPRLKLSTIDAFQSKFVGAFATELGVVGNIKIMDDFDKQRAQRRVLNALFAKMSSQKALIERFTALVTIASMGKAQKKILDKISEYIKKSHEMFIEYPYLNRWGNADLLDTKIKPCVWNAAEYEANLKNFLDAVAEDLETKKISEFKTFFINSRLGAVYKGSKLVRDWKEFLREGGELEEFYIPSKDESHGFTIKEIPPMRKLLAMLLGASVSAACQSAAAIGEIVSEYEDLYSRDVRMRGSLAFDDLCTMLLDSSVQLERNLVEFRLDSKINHWLIDEFQDTSRAQWGTLQNLIDEIFLDDSGERTFYYVGDKKQSIYGWRGGAPELFDEIFNAHEGLIRDGSPLTISWRSVSPVITAVNALFSSPLLDGFDFNASTKWLDDWLDHKSHPTKGDNGCVCLIERDQELDLEEQVYRVISKINPLRSNLTCAVLVQRNSVAKSLLEGLRARFKRDGSRLSIAGEFDSGIADDNMVVCAILKLLHAAAHPLDTASSEYVRMTPLAPYVSCENSSAQILEKISSSGFENFIAEVYNFLDSLLEPDDVFSRKKIGQLKQIAAEFAERGGIDEFIEFVRSHKVRESSKESLVRVMTIHGSKGLDFDFVVLPEVENLKKNGSAVSLRRVAAKDGGEVVINMPSSDMCAFDRTLNASITRSDADDAFATICKFYVAVTRAKRGVYFISKWFSDKKSTAMYSFAEHILNVLFDENKCEMFENMNSCVPVGDPFWYKKIAPLKVESETFLVPFLKNPRRAVLPLPSKSPSVGEDFNFTVSEFSSTPTNAGKDFGTLVHSIFEKLSTFNGDVPNAVFAAASRIRADKLLTQSACTLIISALQNVQIRALFLPAANLEVKSELPFSVIDSSFVVSGIFDRLNIFRSPSGSIEKIAIIDFKTDSANFPDSVLIKKYSPQIESYKRAVSIIYSLNPSKIEAFLLIVNSSPRLINIS